MSKKGSNGWSVFFSCLFSIALILLLVSIIRFTTDLPPITFSSFLQSLSECPNVTVHVFGSSVIYDDWGLFNFLRDFINFLSQIIDFSIFAISSLLQLVFFLFYFLRVFFLI